MSTTSLYAQVPKEQAVEMQSLAVQVKETDACSGKSSALREKAAFNCFTSRGQSKESRMEC